MAVMDKVTNGTNGKNRMQTVRFLGDVAHFGGRNGSDADAADLIVKWASGRKWAIRVRKAGNGAVVPDPTFNPDLRATAVIGIVPRNGKKQDIKFFSARTGRELALPENV